MSVTDAGIGVVNGGTGVTRTHFNPVIASSTALICHCEEHSDVAISMALNRRLRTAVATETRLPRYARNDKVGTLATTKWLCLQRQSGYAHNDTVGTFATNTVATLAMTQWERMGGTGSGDGGGTFASLRSNTAQPVPDVRTAKIRRLLGLDIDRYVQSPITVDYEVVRGIHT